MEEWKKRNFHPDGIYTGFVAGKQQVEKILKFLRIFRKEDTLLLVDPVMGDRGEVYDFMTQDLCNEMKRLAENADVLTCLLYTSDCQSDFLCLGGTDLYPFDDIQYCI